MFDDASVEEKRRKIEKLFLLLLCRVFVVVFDRRRRKRGFSITNSFPLPIHDSLLALNGVERFRLVVR